MFTTSQDGVVRAFSLADGSEAASFRACGDEVTVRVTTQGGFSTQPLQTPSLRLRVSACSPR